MEPDGRPTRYFALHFRMLRFLGLGWWHHPDQNNFDNHPGWYWPYSIICMLVWVCGFVGLETIDPFTGDKDADRFMLSMSFVVTHNLTLVKLYLFFFRSNDLQKVVRILEIELYDYYQDNNKNRKTVKASHYLTGAFLFFGWATIGNSTINGAIQDFRWRAIVRGLNSTQPRPERTLPQPVWIPWKTQTEGPYVTAFTLEAIGLLWTGHIVMIIDTLISSILLHMSGQFEILQDAYTNIYEHTMERLRSRLIANSTLMITKNEVMDLDEIERVVLSHYSQDEIENELDKQLDNCIKQHQLLIKCIELFERTYTYGFLTQLASSLAAICVIMVQVAANIWNRLLHLKNVLKDVSSFGTIRFATSLAFFFTMITQLAIQCFSANEVTFQGLQVAEAAALSRWERAHNSFRRRLVFVIQRAQKPVYITAGSFTNMSTHSFLSIVKAAYSYYAVIQSQS